MALVWQTADPQQQAVANRLCQQVLTKSPKWRIAFKGEGLVVLHRGEIQGQFQAYPLTNQGGVVVGKLFTRRYIDIYQPGDCAPTDPALDDTESQKIINSDGRYLIDHYWGRYMAFITKNTADTRYIVRDPSGALPCFVTAFQGVNIYFSDMEDCAQLNGLSFTINWHYIAAHLKFIFPQRDDTGLNEVSMLLPGECEVITPRTTKKVFYWDSVRIAQTTIIEDPADAALRLHRTTIGCVNAWASCYRGIIHRLSGGLDSSIVLGCLKQGAPAPYITYAHYISGDAHDDEVALARLATMQAGVKLLEKSLPLPSVDLETPAKMPRTACPNDFQHTLGIATFEVQLAKEIRAEALFSGRGGDELFFSPPVNLGAVDYAYRYGFGPSLISAAMDSARICKQSLWSVLGVILKDRLFKRPTDPYGILEEFEEESIVSDEVMNAVTRRDIQHPLLDTADVLPPGKFFHLYMLCVPYTLSGGGFGAQFEQTHWVDPLLSQPLIELCLQMPVYLLSHGGRNRGLARLAFARDVAPEIIARHAKGSGKGYQDMFFKKNIGAYQAALLEGELVRSNILDRHKLELALSGHNHANVPINCSDLRLYLNLETWLTKWSDSRLKVAV